MKNPCDKCTRRSKDGNCTQYKTCNDWKFYFRTAWKQFNGYPVRATTEARRRAEQKKKARTAKFLYEHPDIIREYLQNGPCADCKLAKACDVPCAAYWHWWDARMEYHKRRLGM